jgi:hypothetical protein
MLTADKVITVRRSAGAWPFCHSCTNQLDLPLYASREKLVTALKETLANGSAGGFHELRE